MVTYQKRVIVYDPSVSMIDFGSIHTFPFTFATEPVIEITPLGSGNFAGIAMHVYLNSASSSNKNQVTVVGSYTVNGTSRIFGYCIRAVGYIS